MKRSTKLVISIIADLLGMASYFFPIIGGLLDGIYAPIYMLWIRFAYKDWRWGIFGGIEELLPFTDAIPTATIAHFLVPYLKSKKKTSPK